MGPNKYILPTPVAERSKARVCGRSLAELTGSNPAVGMHVCLLWVLCVISRTGLWDEPIPAPEKSYRLCCVSLCVIENSQEWGGHGPHWAVAPDDDDDYDDDDDDDRNIYIYTFGC